ncbi:hypothetical protein [Pseudoxanthomonas suwonensis]|nr:hypothetical protein [Pseudoxanthomonas suwonensis]
MEFVLFFIALALFAAQQKEVAGLKKRVDALEAERREAGTP